VKTANLAEVVHDHTEVPRQKTLGGGGKVEVHTFFIPALGRDERIRCQSFQGETLVHW